MNSISNKIATRSVNLLSNYKLNRNEFICQNFCYKSVATAAVKYAIAASTFFTLRNYKKIKNLIEGKKPVVKEYPPDTVIIYQFPRAYSVPTISMFALKLETWCRAAGIKYQNEFGMKTSSQGLIPFIRLNNYVVEDSQKCIEYLSKVMQKDLNAGLTDEQRAVSRLVLKICDDSFKWGIALLRFWHSDKNLRELRIPTLNGWFISYRIYRAGLKSGYAKYSKNELIENFKKDLKAVDTIIGNKKYLFSDSKPCDTDFAVFGHIAQIIHCDMEPYHQYLITDCQNLIRHTENIKQLYWKDWESSIRKTKLALAKVNQQPKQGFASKLLNLVLKRK